MMDGRARVKRIPYLGFAALASLAVASPVAAAGGSFTGLGFLNPSFPSSTNPYVDADGTVVAGTSNYADGLNEAFIWTSSGGIVGLGFANRTHESAAGGISANGQVVDGTAQGTEQGDITFVAFRWTAKAGLEAFNDQKAATGAFGLNRNGSIMAGNEGEEALRWTKGDVHVQHLGFLGVPNSGSPISLETGMDATGDYIIGSSSTSTAGQSEAFVWNGGMSGLGFPSGDNASFALGIGSDSKTIVGFGYVTNTNETTAFYWTTLGGMQVLSAPAGLPYAVASAVSNNGSVIVGCATASTQPNIGDEAVMWNSHHVPKTVASIAAMDGISIAGWTLSCATSVSAGGKTIVGNGIDPDGHNQAWLLQLP